MRAHADSHHDTRVLERGIKSICSHVPHTEESEPVDVSSEKRYPRALAPLLEIEPSDQRDTVVGPHDPAEIFGGRRLLIQQSIAAGHWNILTPSGGPH